MSRVSRLLFGSTGNEVTGLVSSLQLAMQHMEKIAALAERTEAALDAQQNMLTGLQGAIDAIAARQRSLDERLVDLEKGQEAIVSLTSLPADLTRIEARMTAVDEVKSAIAALPARFDELAAATTQTRTVLDELAARREQLDAVAGLASLPADLARIEARMTAVDEVKSAIAALPARFDELAAATTQTRTVLAPPASMPVDFAQQVENLNARLQPVDIAMSEQLEAFENRMNAAGDNLVNSIDQALLKPVDALQKKVSMIDKTLLSGVSSLGASMLSLRASVDRQASILAGLVTSDTE